MDTHISHQWQRYMDQIRSVFCFPIRAQVLRCYRSTEGLPVADCQEYLDLGIGQIFEAVPLPQIWGNSSGGVFVEPSVGTMLVLGFERGLKEHPFVATIYGSGAELQAALPDSFVLKQGQAEIRLQDEKVQMSANGEDMFSVLDTLLNDLESLQVEGPVTLTAAGARVLGNVILDTTMNFRSKMEQLAIRVDTLLRAPQGDTPLVSAYKDPSKYGTK